MLTRPAAPTPVVPRRDTMSMRKGVKAGGLQQKFCISHALILIRFSYSFCCNLGFVGQMRDDACYPIYARQPTIPRSSAKLEYRVVALAVAESCWLHQLLQELHRPLRSATLVYVDNVSAIYMLTNQCNIVAPSILISTCPFCTSVGYLLYIPVVPLHVLYSHSWP
jgi:hypothetical protein